jgi:hypothetical protein
MESPSTIEPRLEAHDEPCPPHRGLVAGQSELVVENVRSSSRDILRASAGSEHELMPSGSVSPPLSSCRVGRFSRHTRSTSRIRRRHEQLILLGTTRCARMPGSSRSVSRVRKTKGRGLRARTGW